MEQSATDRRIIRTRQIITHAYLELLKEKSNEDIVIRDITERANVNRSTFYAHYQDKNDLLNKIISETMSTLSREMSELPIAFRIEDTAAETIDPYFTTFFNHVAKHEKFYRTMFVSSPTDAFTERMLEEIRSIFYERAARIGKDKKLSVPLDLLLDYLCTSLYGICKRWLEQGMVYSSNHMALQLTRLSNLGVYNAMGLKDASGNAS
ncbi:TetR/AcrR family transcriptional regulator [Paenibacillus sp. NPDC058071]|uniref:TetR/AcrR family transcriptional regulator n=1 Tax=Paenibacillus sp. NPDC058071 TaxID=3346326 RepID=UPI0036DF8E31